MQKNTLEISNNHLKELSKIISEYSKKTENEYSKFIETGFNSKIPNEYLLKVTNMQSASLNIKILPKYTCIVYYKNNKELSYTENSIKNKIQINKVASMAFFIMLDKLNFSLDKTFVVKIYKQKSIYQLSSLEKFIIKIKLEFLIFISNLREFLGL